MSALERAARALCAVSNQDDIWDAMNETYREQYRLEARAVLMAVRSLDAEDLDGACRLAHMDRYTVNTAWIAMIQAILDEGEGR